MNMQNLMREAQKMQAELQKTQKELETTTYVGESALVSVTLNGSKEMIKLEIKDKESFEQDDLEILEDMIMVAHSDAVKKIDADKEKKMSKYGKGIAGLM